MFAPNAPTFSFSDLTEKQQETARLLAEGLTAKEIASRLDISHSAVAQRIENLRTKAGGITKNELARMARAWLASVRETEKPFMLDEDTPSSDACIKYTGQKNDLPRSRDPRHESPRNQLETELKFSDSFAFNATPPWDAERYDKLVPEVLDGEHAVPARWVLIIAMAIGMAVLLLVLLAVANTLGDLV